VIWKVKSFTESARQLSLLKSTVSRKIRQTIKESIVSLLRKLKPFFYDEYAIQFYDPDHSEYF